ncbi:MAG TPA: hypothetical protein PKX38_05555 [Alphaproteobacteria bacterium]|jgi:hypothetical protein|nr:hypothetical protein [Micavibrio sp.]MBK9563397.1 hypothetical protein [Micavibrio sp.]HQX27388.1 hypothetical protein [Alphaproteobacteria bacterium]
MDKQRRHVAHRYKENKNRDSFWKYIYCVPNGQKRDEVQRVDARMEDGKVWPAEGVLVDMFSRARLGGIDEKTISKNVAANAEMNLSRYTVIFFEDTPGGKMRSGIPVLSKGAVVPLDQQEEVRKLEGQNVTCYFRFASGHDIALSTKLKMQTAPQAVEQREGRPAFVAS